MHPPARALHAAICSLSALLALPASAASLHDATEAAFARTPSQPQLAVAGAVRDATFAAARGEAGAALASGRLSTARSLLDAARHRHDPELPLAEEDVRAAAAALQEQRLRRDAARATLSTLTGTPDIPDPDSEPAPPEKAASGEGDATGYGMAGIAFADEQVPPRHHALAQAEARLALEEAEAALPTLQRESANADERAEVNARLFASSDASLAQLVHSRALAYDADMAAVQARIGVLQARSRLNQALGVLP
jgi:hypothetical protein